jgi:hypothetical protein
MPVLATLGAASTRGFGGFYETTAISASNWIAKAGTRLVSTAFDGTGNLYSVSGSGIIIKTASDGSATWKKSTTVGSSTAIWEKVAVVSPSVIYVTGSYFTSGYIPLFAVLNGSGNVTSARSITTAGGLSNLAVSSSGAVYTSGYITTSNGGTVLVNHFFKIVNGAITTKRYYNNQAEVNFGFIGAGSSDSVYIGGDVSTPPITKINSSFGILWKFLYSSIDANQAVESNGNLYVAATYSVSPFRVAVMKLNASTGTLVWARVLSATSSSRGFYVAVDDSSNVYVGGRTSTDSVIIKVDSDGNLVWQRSVSIGVASSILSISVNTATNTIYALCSPTSSGNAYSFILSIPTDGSLTGTYSVGGTSVTYSSTSETFSTLTPTSTSPSLSFSTSTLADTSRTLTVAEATPTYDLITLP